MVGSLGPVRARAKFPVFGDVTVIRMKHCITLHVVRSDVLLHALGGFADVPSPPLRFWRIEEDDYLRRMYTFVDMDVLQAQLPNRSPGTLRKRACELCLTRPKRKTIMLAAQTMPFYPASFTARTGDLLAASAEHPRTAVQGTADS